MYKNEEIQNLILALGLGVKVIISSPNFMVLMAFQFAQNQLMPFWISNIREKTSTRTHYGTIRSSF